jgi:CheY-like chemotaxis protein
MPYKLLLADDSVTIQRVIELTFADEDVKVTAVGDGQQAIDHITSDRPDIVLADVGMPMRDGYEVAAFIKNKPDLEHIPVLLLTGAFEPVDEERARAVKCNGVLAKPFEPQMLIGRVKELLAAVKPSTEGAPAPAEAAVRAAEPPAPVEPAVEPPAPPPPPSVQEIAAEGWAPVNPEHPVEDRGPLPEVSNAVRGEDLVLDTAALHLRPAPPPAADVSLDDYFDRLDAAFAHLTGSPAGRDAGLPRPPAVEQWAPTPTPGMWPDLPEGRGADAEAAPVVLGPRGAAQGVPGTDRAASTSAPGEAIGAAPLLTVPVAEAFASLLEAERQQRPGAVRAGEAAAGGTVLLPGTLVTENLVAEVARRVAERLSDPMLREVVVQVVSSTAERLVREEIERLKASVK